MANPPPLEQARRWWKERTDAERYVVSPAEAPSLAVARVLRQDGLVLDVASKRAWILTPGKVADGRAVFLANYWAVVALVLKRYAPAAVAGVAAIRLHLEDFSPPEELPVYQGANQSEYALTLYPGFRLRLRPRPLAAENVVTVTAPGNALIPVQTPMEILTTLDETEVVSGIEPGAAWLRHLILRTPDVEAAVEKNPRPVSPKRVSALPKFKWQSIRADAQQNKAYDAYHSTTMEGYRISREVSDAIVRGEPLPDGPQDQKTLEAAMAVQGYTVAYSEVLERARKQGPINTDLILDLYEALFRPAVDARITDPAALRGWRVSTVGLRGWRYVPPHPKKIPDLIRGLERFAARENLDPITRALLVHLEFVTIHPFMDGNGRLGRLLMNYALLVAGLPWATIRSDERIPSFRALERAQVDGDAKPFIQFVWHLIRQAVQELKAAQRRRS